jgi:hypothetical protein
MDPDDLRTFARRDRSAVEQQKREYWARMYRERGGLYTMQVGHALWEYARRVRPDIPTARDRAEDLMHHVALKERLDRASRALGFR